MQASFLLLRYFDFAMSELETFKTNVYDKLTLSVGTAAAASFLFLIYSNILLSILLHIFQ